VWLEWLLLAALVALFVDKGLLPGWRRLHTDFPNYFLAARLFRKGIPLERAYDWVWFQRQKDHEGIDWGVVGYVPLSPYSALVLAPLAALAPLQAKHWWLCFNVLLLVAAIALLRPMTRMPARRLAIVAFLTIVPLQTSFQFGQQHVAILFLLAASGWLYVRGRDASAGALLAVASAIKLYPLLFGVFFLLKRRWSALVGLCVAASALIALGFVWFGAETMRAYALEVLPRALSGEGNDPYWAGFNTPAVLLRRLFIPEPELNPHPLVDAPTAFVLLQPSIASLIFVSALWFVAPGNAASRSREAFEWGAFVALLLVLSTSSSSYHFCALILTTALAVDFLVGAGRGRVAAVLLGFHALVSAPLYRLVPSSPSGWSIFLGFPRLYALCGYWAVVLWALARVDTGPRRLARDAKWFAMAFGVMALYGIVSTARHYDGQIIRSEQRLGVGTTGLVANAPAPSPGGVYYSRMGDEGYVLDRTGPALLTTSTERGLDLFHPAVSPSSGMGWVEVAGRRSRVVRFPLGASSIAAAELPTELDDAEQPCVSADAHWLAFLREENSSGSLWVASRRATEAAGTEVPVQLADAGYDVREFAFFPDGRIVFAAGRDATGLFVTGPTPGPIARLSTTAARARYPAVSPDGRSLAYSGQERSAWHLRVIDLQTGSDRRLTHADCNAITPAWTEDSHTIVYASDCGRNIGNTTLLLTKAGR
jgi:hypothetical protein